MASVVLWTGPVSASNLEGVQWRTPTTVVVVNQGIGGIGSSAFAELGRSLGPNPLRAILSQRGLNLDDFATVGIAGFSAAHGLIEVILQSDDAVRVTAVHAADAYYTGMDKSIKRGYRSFAERATQGNATLSMTSSASAGPGHPSGIDSVFPLIQVLGLQPIKDIPGVPPPEDLLGRGSCVWANYGDEFLHVQHATELVVPWLNAVMVPALAGNRPRFGGLSWVGTAFLFGAVGASAYLLSKRWLD